jgi:hypothetical protein
MALKICLSLWFAWTHCEVQGSYLLNRGSHSKAARVELAAKFEEAVAGPGSEWERFEGMAHMVDDEVFDIAPEDVL